MSNIVKKITIERFRGIDKFEWSPGEGINCLIGSGDSGKSTVLDAIDWCIGARRNLPITDADFYLLNAAGGFRIDIVLGQLSDSLKNFERYGSFLVSYDPEQGELHKEPKPQFEDALVVRLEAGDDLEPEWSLVSERASEQGIKRQLGWPDRQALSPLRLGAYADRHLSWQHGSVLSRMSESPTGVKSALADAARSTRSDFGDAAKSHVDTTLTKVRDTALNLGVGVGNEVKALLDIQAMSFKEGLIALHGENDVPLRRLGLGSSRLLVAGLQKEMADSNSIMLIDELEHGLEPHRIVRLLHSIGSKKTTPDRQVFITTHSPAVIRELQFSQLAVLRNGGNQHVLSTPTESAQGQLRSNAEAFLSPKVLVCEGATEVGLIRGIDLYRSETERVTAAASGVIAVDAGGVSKIYSCASVFQELGYDVAVLRDDDVQPDANAEKLFTDSGGSVFCWSQGAALENEIFAHVGEEAVISLVGLAKQFVDDGSDKVQAQVGSACGTSILLNQWMQPMTDAKRATLAGCAKSNANPWFKRIDRAEEAAFTIIAPDLDELAADSPLLQTVSSIFDWATNA